MVVRFRIVFRGLAHRLKGSDQINEIDALPGQRFRKRPMQRGKIVLRPVQIIRVAFLKITQLVGKPHEVKAPAVFLHMSLQLRQRLGGLGALLGGVGILPAAIGIKMQQPVLCDHHLVHLGQLQKLHPQQGADADHGAAAGGVVCGKALPGGKKAPIQQALPGIFRRFGQTAVFKIAVGAVALLQRNGGNGPQKQQKEDGKDQICGFFHSASSFLRSGNK